MQQNKRRDGELILCLSVSTGCGSQVQLLGLPRLTYLFSNFPYIGMPDGSQTVRGYDFNKGVDYHQMFQSFVRTGFQATNVGKSIEEINRMVSIRYGSSYRTCMYVHYFDSLLVSFFVSLYSMETRLGLNTWDTALIRMINN